MTARSRCDRCEGSGRIRQDGSNLSSRGDEYPTDRDDPRGIVCPECLDQDPADDAPALRPLAKAPPAGEELEELFAALKRSLESERRGRSA